MSHITIDFESRSLVDLRKTTAARYAEDPSTDILCLSVRRDDGINFIWCPDWVRKQLPSEFKNTRYASKDIVMAAVREAKTIEAHNSGFEQLLWQHIMVKRYRFPEIPVTKWRCSAAKAAMHGLPRALGQVTKVLELEEQKDNEGHKLMMKMCKPLNPLKSQYVKLADELGLTFEETKGLYGSAVLKDRHYSGEHDHKLVRWHETPEALMRLIEYCEQDTASEEVMSKRLKELPKSELDIFHLDAVINDRGLPVDVEAVDAMLKLIEAEKAKLIDEFCLITGGEVDSPNCYEAFKNWIISQGVFCEGVGADAIADMLNSPCLPPVVREALLIAQKANKSSTAKYDALRRGISSDSRFRGGFLYHGASTGRWAHRGFQPGNLPRGDFQDVDKCIEAVLSGDLDYVELMWGSLMSVASTCIRGMIAAPEGKKLLCADFSAIEGRVLAWLAGEESELDVYREGKDPYCATAADCFNRSYEDIVEGHRAGDAAMSKLRHKGKTGTLACGFGGGVGAIKVFASDMGDREAKDLVTRWRKAHPKTVRFWYALRDAVAGREETRDRPGLKGAIRDPGKVYTAGKIKFCYRKEYGFLMCKLPSGRMLYYPFPSCYKETIGPKAAAHKAKEAGVGRSYMFAGTYYKYLGDDMFEERPRYDVTREVHMDDLWEKTVWTAEAWTVDGATKKWVQRTLNHLILSENVTQAVAADLLRAAMLKVEKAGYPIILHVHDEIVSEVDENFGSVSEFESLMCDTPDWAEGLPIEAEGWEGKRFRK